jgi:hypothetical protein
MQNIPRQGIAQNWSQTITNHRDPSISSAIHQADATTGGGIAPRHMNRNTAILKTLNTGFSNGIAAQGRKKMHRPIHQLCQLDSNHGPSTRRLLKPLFGMTNQARLRPSIHGKKINPFDMTNNG